MALRIACDLDGTVADMGAALQREAEKLFGDVDLRAGSGLPPEPPADSESGDADAPDAPEAPPPTPAPMVRRGLTRREYRELWTHVRRMDNFWCTLREIEPGSIARFQAIATTYRWEVIFLTQRPSCAGDIVQVQSQRWLQAQGFTVPSVFVVEGSRGHIAAALHLDAVMDDRPENCLDVATQSEALPLLIWREARHLAPPGAARMRIETLFSFNEALDRLEALSASRTSGGAGLLGRIRQAFGI